MKYVMDSWARMIKNDQDLPESFVDFFNSLKADTFPYTIFAPPEKWCRHKTSPKLLVMMDDRIYIAEKFKKQILPTCFLFQDMNYIETGTLLLNSWLEINGMVNGQPTTMTVEYNTVVEIYFKQIVEKIRLTIHSLDQSDFAKTQLKIEQSKFDVLVKSNYKYMNFGKRSILPGEQIRQFILQPDIRVKIMKYFHRTFSFNHLTILTNHELILVKDVDSIIYSAQQVRHGGVWRYIALNKVLKVTTQNILEHDLIKLIVILPEGVSIHSLFSASQRSELDLLLRTVDSSLFPQRECV